MNPPTGHSCSSLTPDEINQIITELDIRFYEDDILPHLTPQKGNVNADLFKKAFNKNPELASQLGFWLGAMWKQPTESEGQLGNVLLHPKVGYFITYPGAPSTLAFIGGFLAGAFSSSESIMVNELARIKMEKIARLFHNLFEKYEFAEAFLTNFELITLIVKLENVLKLKELLTPETSLIAQMETVLNNKKVSSQVKQEFPDELEGAVLLMGGRSKKKKSTATLYQEKYEYLRKNILPSKREQVLLTLLGVKTTENAQGDKSLIIEGQLTEILSNNELELWGKIFDWVLPSFHDIELRNLVKAVNTINPPPISCMFILRRFDANKGQTLADSLLKDLQNSKISDSIFPEIKALILQMFWNFFGLETDSSLNAANYCGFKLVSNRDLQARVERNLSQVDSLAQLEETSKNLISFLFDIRSRLIAQ